MNEEKLNPWELEDEIEHKSSLLEWWYIESFFKTKNPDIDWSIKAGFTEWQNKKEVGCYVASTLFNTNDDKCIYFQDRTDNIRFKTNKEKLELKYKDCFLKGGFPEYHIYINDTKHNIKIDFKLISESYPHWIAQDVSKGWLPMGFGFFRYGYIPKLRINGTITIDDKEHIVDGKSYYEHVWVDFWYDNPLSVFSNMKKTLSIYSSLAGCWIKKNKIKIPKSIGFGTENSPFGYDWAWAILDNGWTIFYGNVLFWLTDGPVFGTLILSKDGKKFKEFYNACFRYKKTIHSKNFDFNYPSEIEIIAEDEEEKIILNLITNNTPHEYTSDYDEKNYWKALVICELTGIVKGYYKSKSEEFPLSGKCKIEPQRQPTPIGHNYLKIDFLKPKKGFGISWDLESNLLKRNLKAKINILPKPKIKFRIKRKID